MRPPFCLDSSATSIPRPSPSARRSLDVLKRGQGPDGGWGPYVTSQSEPFDTALAVLALAGVRSVDALSTSPYSDRDLDGAIDRAREYLVGAQSPDGSWPETTRPPNGESYAQRISTTAWSLLALLESRLITQSSYDNPVFSLVPCCPDPEGDGDALRVGALVDGIEIVDLERAADLIAGDVLQDVEREQVIGARRATARAA